MHDGADSYAFEIGAGVIEGPQMAQRMVTKAVMAAHLADYFDVDHRACLIAPDVSGEAASWWICCSTRPISVRRAGMQVQLRPRQTKASGTVGLNA